MVGKERKVKINYCLFESALGNIALAWSEKGVAHLQLPEEDDEHTLRLLRMRLPANAVRVEAPGWVSKIIASLRLHLDGQLQDFSDLKLDLDSCSPFARLVYEECRKIPCGLLLSYSQLAERISKPKSSRAVGRALGANPVALIIPCHRVVGKSGKMTGFSAYGGCNTKMRLLSIERALSSDKALMEPALC